ncbi:MAG: alpha/beta hydrolase [Syntrophales bacterium]|jgi:pimeloyl-ACP methyl ester carboxylesterase|nr:alpha/beta hydrolase [Syntrophales bacterium]
MEYVTSKDGTQIAYERRGEGPPLVLVHGAAADHSRWKSLLPALKKYFTVYAVDRRGRGQSGDVRAYAIEREYEDVVAVVDSIPAPVNLLGHSYGAICSLEASLRTSNIRKLILYEPPIPIDLKKNISASIISRMKACLHVGKREEALLLFLQEIVRIPQKEIDILRLLPNWSFRVATAHTIPREEACAKAYVLAPQRFSHMETHTLLLLGGDSPSSFKDAIEALKISVPNSRIATMHRQGHAAMETAPELFLEEVIGFLSYDNH